MCSGSAYVDLQLCNLLCIGLVDILKRHVPVGISGHWWLLQHGADLYMLDLRIVAEDLAHQQVRPASLRLSLSDAP